MDLARALRIDTSSHPIVSFAGSGGKTTALFLLARQLAAHQPVILTATSHLGVWQIPMADHHILVKGEADFHLPNQGVMLVTGEIENERTKPVSEAALNWLYEFSRKKGIPLLIEADGSRQKPLKAPAEHEPSIPSFTEIVIHVSGLSGLGKPLDSEHVHRPELFSQRSGLALGESVSAQALTRVLTHPQGGLNNVPASARRVALLNQADTPELRVTGGGMARDLLSAFDSVLVGSLQQVTFATLERTAGIILAAGKSSRYGATKQLLDWNGKPFVRQVTETALRAGLEPVVVVTGFHHAEIESALNDLPVSIVHNADYEQGQSTSVKAGIRALPKNIGAAVFLLADQPQIPVEVIRSLMEAHTHKLTPIVAPLVLEERRANPVLFDRDVFADLLQLTGDTGGRAVFHKHPVEYLPWHDDILLFDVDKPEDYEKLKRLQS